MKNIKIDKMNYRVLSVDDYHVVIDEINYPMIGVLNIEDSEAKLKRHNEWCTAYERRVF